MEETGKRQWGVLIDNRKGVIYTWDLEKEKWVKGLNSEDNPHEYFACVLSITEIRNNPEPFIKTLNETKKQL